MSEIKLKPCPFCGARPLINNENYTVPGFQVIETPIYEVRCIKCTATLNRWFNSEQEAVEAWNKRAYEEASV